MAEITRNLAIIPARSGSKGLRDKNILPLKGIPLLAYSINAARLSGLFNEIFVSTDSEKYAEISRQYGADVPFLRSKALSEDKSSSWDAVMEALQKFKGVGKEFDNVCLLQPTSPLRTEFDIIESYKLMRVNDANAVIGMTQVDHSPLWCNTLDASCSLENFIAKEIQSKPRQELPPYFRINGAIYWVKTEYLMKSRNFYNNTCYAYKMPQNRSIDIDTQLDFELAKLLIK